MNNVFDIVVCGGGMGGVCSVIAAARKGISVLLVEKYGFAGGMATSGLVNPFMSFRRQIQKADGAWECGEGDGDIIASPIFVEIVNRLKSMGAADESGQIFDDEILKFVLDGMLIESGAKILYHSFVSGAKINKSSIDEISLTTKSDNPRIRAKVFIDATGDGDLAYLAGFPYEMGAGDEGDCQPMTLCFRVGGVSGFSSFGEVMENLNSIYSDAKKSGAITIPRENVLLFRTLRPDVIHFNTTRIIGKDGTDSMELGQAEIEGRSQAMSLFSLFREKSAFFKDAFMLKMACQIGVRETRRITGAYKLTAGDVVGAKTFGDGIARSSYPIDIHNPKGEGTVIKKVEGPFYEIPFRCLIPEESTNLLMACRAISSTHEAHSSLRVMPVVASIGQAAGFAAAEAVKNKKPLSEIDGKILKSQLLSAP